MKEVERALTQAGATTLPLDADRYDTLMKTLPTQEASRISSKLKYLEQTFSSAAIEPLVTQEDEVIPFGSYIQETIHSINDVGSNNLFSSANATHLHIPEGYTELYEDVISTDYLIDLSRDTFEVPVTQAGNETLADTVIVSLRRLKTLDKRMNDLVPLPTKSSSNLFFLQQFSVYEGAVADNGERISPPKLNLRGYMLTKGTSDGQ